MKPHKHAELIKAWADGALIEYWSKTTKQWTDVEAVNPYWRETTEYRIKPEPQPDVVFKSCVHWNVKMHCMNQILFGDPNVRFTFDGNTGNLKSAEAI